MTQGTSDTVVLIHGLWMTPLCWEHWIERYKGRGFQVLAPAWPGMDGDIAQLRRDTSGIDRLTAHEIIDHYDSIIRALPAPPIIMGHSFGGLFTQVLLSHGLGAAGIAIDSAPAKGILSLPLSTLRSAWPVLHNPANAHRAVALTPEQFHYAFTNTLTEEESRPVYERYAIPGPGHVLFEGALANINPHSAFAVDFNKSDRAPLLFIAGGADHVVPASSNRANVKHYRKSKAITAYKEFAGRSHYTLGQDGWEAVADFALAWATNPTANVDGAGATGA
ncbi:MAG TPA: alpha/beta hydrolase [Dehalococcoidia bacterium]|jgi:pimeloyl-ACP methyl ester carboxylesterase